MHYSSNEAALASVIDLDGLDALDVGCGRGELVSFMNRNGAIASGLECNPAQIEAARAARPEIALHEGVGEAMPFADGSFDLVVFMFSLHHVPVEAQPKALEEAARVLRPGGTLYVAEPLCEGSGFEVHRPVDDETAVRGEALKALHAVPADILAPVSQYRYETSYHYLSFDAFKDDMIRISPDRRASFERQESYLATLFDDLGVAEDEGVRFDQPVRVNRFAKS